MKGLLIWLLPSGSSSAWGAEVALAKRIIPCLDVDGGRVVKGVRFEGLRDAGDPVEIARRYDEQGADELAFLDITASHQERDTLIHMVEAVAAQVFIPLTVGGGVRNCADVRRRKQGGKKRFSAAPPWRVRISSARLPIISVPNASWWPSMRVAYPAPRPLRGGKSTPTVGVGRPVLMPWPGPNGWLSSALVSCW